MPWCVAPWSPNCTRRIGWRTSVQGRGRSESHPLSRVAARNRSPPVPIAVAAMFTVPPGSSTTRGRVAKGAWAST